MRICSQDCTKTSLMSLKLALNFINYLISFRNFSSPAFGTIYKSLKTALQLNLLKCRFLFMNWLQSYIQLYLSTHLHSSNEMSFSGLNGHYLGS